MNRVGLCLLCAVLGIISGMLGTFLAIRSSVNQIVERYQACSVERDALMQQNHRQQQIILESQSTATVLYEGPTQGLSGVVSMLAGAAPRSDGSQQPRWFIPGCKAKPIVYGDPRAVSVFYVDSQGRKEGPLAPELLPQ